MIDEKSIVAKLLADGWQERELGQPSWRWFIRGVENAYVYQLAGEVYFASSFRAVVSKLPCWFLSRGFYLIKIFHVDPVTVQRSKIPVGKKLREGSGNFQNKLFEKIR